MRVSVAVIFNAVVAKAAFERTEERKDPERRPTDLTAKERDRVDIVAKHKTIKVKEDCLFMNT
jgi:hypothetical protein